MRVGERGRCARVSFVLAIKDDPFSHFDGNESNIFFFFVGHLVTNSNTTAEGRNLYIHMDM